MKQEKTGFSPGANINIGLQEYPVYEFEIRQNVSLRYHCYQKSVSMVKKLNLVVTSQNVELGVIVLSKPGRISSFKNIVTL